MSRIIAITLTQPWATLVVTGHKQIETRSWPTKHRGPILIHAAAGFPKSARDLCATVPFNRALASSGITSWKDLPTGAILGGVQIVDCKSTDVSQVMDGLTERQRVEEALFGDYSEDRYGWRLREPWTFTEPVACKGTLSLWTVPEEVVAILNEERHTVPNCYACKGDGLFDAGKHYAECPVCGGQGWRREAAWRQGGDR